MICRPFRRRYVVECALTSLVLSQRADAAMEASSAKSDLFPAEENIAYLV
jgi:hypothetical protein